MNGVVETRILRTCLNISSSIITHSHVAYQQPQQQQASRTCPLHVHCTSSARPLHEPPQQPNIKKAQKPPPIQLASCTCHDTFYLLSIVFYYILRSTPFTLPYIVRYCARRWPDMCNQEWHHECCWRCWRCLLAVRHAMQASISRICPHFAHLPSTSSPP